MLRGVYPESAAADSGLSMTPAAAQGSRECFKRSNAKMPGSSPAPHEKKDRNPAPFPHKLRKGCGTKFVGGLFQHPAKAC
jgi:hypothetical protein